MQGLLHLRLVQFNLPDLAHRSHRLVGFRLLVKLDGLPLRDALALRLSLVHDVAL